MSQLIQISASVTPEQKAFLKQQAGTATEIIRRALDELMKKEGVKK